MKINIYTITMGGRDHYLQKLYNFINKLLFFNKKTYLKKNNLGVTGIKQSVVSK